MQPPLSITQHLKAMFHRLDPLDVKKDELLDSQLALLNHQSTLEYSQSMVNYHTGKIKRLTADIQQDEDHRHRTALSKRAMESEQTAQTIQLHPRASRESS